MHSQLPQRDLVLLGAGHTHAHVLRRWRMHPLPDVRLTCVSDFPQATYSGMLPGTLAGLYPPDAMQIDLVRLCAAVGARLLCARVEGVDVARREVLLADRPPVPFDLLSIGVGSVPRRESLQASDDTLLAIKPMQSFLDRLRARLVELEPQIDGRPLRVAIIGGGVAGVEIAFCLPGRLEMLWGRKPLELTLIDPHDQLVHNLSPRARRLIERELARRGVRCQLGQAAQAVVDGQVELSDGTRLPVDVAILATSAAPSALLGRVDLPHDERGFLLTRPTLQTTADAPVFVVGDCGTIANDPLPKAGVYAVREGPILWENLQRHLRGEPLRAYRPQREFLKLLNTGDGCAILSYRGFAAHARWCWWLKDRIDRRFVAKYQDLEPAPMPNARAAKSGEPDPLRCLGCGGKVSGDVLSRALRRLKIPSDERVLLGLAAPDDAAVVRLPEGRPVTVTADFFTAPLDDPYLVGRLAALHAASDIFALGGKPVAALALATLPVGPPRQQEQLLYELLAGALREFAAMGATLVGGHTHEGPLTTIGFTVLADAGAGPWPTKGGLRAGDALILTKPLGVGVLLAAQMRARCRAAWMDALLATMLHSNQTAAALVGEFALRAVTDVTGFGLAGHLQEMLRASDLAATLRLDQVPLLPGAAELWAEGWESTLAPANRAAAEVRLATPELAQRPELAALFDPQTCGGLLLAVSAADAPALLARLSGNGPALAAMIGQVTNPIPAAPRIFVE